MRWKALIAVLIVGGLLVGCYLHMGGWMMVSGRYAENRLLGLTPAEVVERLGPPSFDPQSANGRPWVETEDGLYHLGYYQNWATCSVTFSDGKVVSVRRSWK